MAKTVEKTNRKKGLDSLTPTSLPTFTVITAGTRPIAIDTDYHSRDVGLYNLCRRRLHVLNRNYVTVVEIFMWCALEVSYGTQCTEETMVR